jgi:hypothetical protein
VSIIREDQTPGAGEGNELAVSTFVALDARVQAQGALLSGLRCAGREQAAAIDQLSRDLGVDRAEVYRRVIGDEVAVPPGPPDETEFERRERLRRGAPVAWSVVSITRAVATTRRSSSGRTTPSRTVGLCRSTPWWRWNAAFACWSVPWRARRWATIS